MNAVPIDTGVANFVFLLQFLQVGEWTIEWMHHERNQTNECDQCSMDYTVNNFLQADSQGHVCSLKMMRKIQNVSISFIYDSIV